MATTRKTAWLLVIAGLMVALISGLAGGSLWGAISGIALTITGGTLLNQPSSPAEEESK